MKYTIVAGNHHLFYLSKIYRDKYHNLNININGKQINKNIVLKLETAKKHLNNYEITGIRYLPRLMVIET